MSYADDVTNVKLKQLENRINDVYTAAAKDMQAKADEYFKTLEKRYIEQYAAYQNGEYTRQEFDAWYQTQVARGKRWERTAQRLAERALEADKIAAAYINNDMYYIYSLNRDYASYELNQEYTDMTFGIYDEHTVKRLIEQGTMPFGTNLNEEKDEAWNLQKINRALTSGILQGLSISDLATAFQQVTNMDRNSAIRNARTCYTEAQNAGRQDAYNEAVEMGIEMGKEWIATMDSRVRDSHKELDGVRVGVDEKFPNGCMYPADRGCGDPAEFMNCRCTMRAIILGAKSSKEHITGKDVQTYNEWKEKRDAARLEKFKESIKSANDDTFK